MHFTAFIKTTLSPELPEAPEELVPPLKSLDKRIFGIYRVISPPDVFLAMM
jgi:hypothetical protein